MTELAFLVDGHRPAHGRPILVDLLRGSQDAKAWLNRFGAGELAVSVVTAAELMAGCRNQREQDLVEKEMAVYSMVWVSELASATAWDWYRQYHLSQGVGFLRLLDCCQRPSSWSGSMYIKRQAFQAIP